MFYHSVVSDWNHGNAHFLRGVARELVERGHEVKIYEPARGWSLCNLVRDHGEAPLRRFREIYPSLEGVPFELDRLDLDEALHEADLVMVHEWNEPELVRRIGEHRARGGRYLLFFHDTHHRLVTDQAGICAFDLRHYDGVLAYGEVLSELYRKLNLARRVWTWHEAADVRVFQPLPERKLGDVVWVGNWGDGERTAEIEEFLVGPVRRLGLRARVYGVRYPEGAVAALQRAGIEYGGWLPNSEVPAAFAKFHLTIHIPRRPYVRMLPGIPTIRPFEALACGIPLLCSPWNDTGHLFTPGKDFLIAEDGAAMERYVKLLLTNPAVRAAMIRHGLSTIRSRHTCAHRVDELLQIYREVRSTHEQLDEHRLLRLKPGFGILEWRRHLLSRIDPGAPRTRPPGHLL